MKKFYFTLLFLGYGLCIVAQDMGGIPVEGLVPIKRIPDATEKTLNNSSEFSTTSEMVMAAGATTPTGNSAEVGITEGQLSVSLSGGANYAIPIAVPPGINGVVPQINLTYNSQGGNGVAGYGWNLSGISSISRIPATKFHDGIIDGVDFNALDRFAFDGQRLMVKNGTNGVYGADRTEYETEGFSNVKIISYGVHPSGANFGPAYFIVEYPDGSKAYYGNSNTTRTITDWAIAYWENPQGVRISYDYIFANNNLSIQYIKYGNTGTNTAINQIQFVYKTRQRPEQAYIGVQSFLRSTILSQIRVFGNGTGFRNYLLDHLSQDITLGYERLSRITESSGDGSKSYNPTNFSYETTAQTINGSPITTDLSVGNITTQNAATVSGDFDGDGRMDFLLYPTTGPSSKAKYWLFSGFTSFANFNIGWEHAVGKFDDIFPVSWLSWSDKLMPMQGWTVIKSNYYTDSTTFTTYSGGSTVPIYFQYEKAYQFPKFIYYNDYNCNGYQPMGQKIEATDRIIDPIEEEPPTPVELNVPKIYLNGDFNGDGLTDVVAIEQPLNYYYQYGCFGYNTTRRGGGTYFVNLDRRLTADFVSYAGYIASSANSQFKVADFNGDGKSDIYVFDAGFVKVYTSNESNYFVLLYENTSSDANIDLTKPILMGDYNGDGKTDFIIPKGPGSSEWYKYSSTGISLVKETQTYSGFNYPTNTSTITYNVVPSDYNNDGKTDLLLTSSSRGSGSNVGSLSVTCYINKNGTFSNTTNNYYTGTISNQADIYTNALPIFLSSSQPNRKLELSFINNNKIFTFNSTKDFSKEHLLRTITTGNGVTESISYKPLDPNSTEGYNTIYTDSGYTENYRNTDIIIAPTFQVVTKLEKQSATVYKKQLFSYYGAVSNMEGLGFLGFRASMRTNWHDDATTIISTVSKFDVNLRGVNTENNSVLYLGYLSGNYNPSDFISRSVLTYESELLPNKVFKLQNTISKQYNGLDNTSSETTTVYDTYTNPIQATTVLKNGGSIEQTSVNNVGYDNQPGAATYYVGRPISKNQSVTASGETMTGEELYTYNNHLLSQIKKKGNATDYITENNAYDPFGNITQKTISAPGLTTRITNYEYDTSGRFLTKSIDIEGLVTSYNYKTANGVLNSETNPYGLTTSYNYDSWFKKIKTTDYMGKSNFYTYTRNAEQTIVAATGDDGSGGQEIIDDLGRKISKGVKDINGNLASVSYL